MSKPRPNKFTQERTVVRTQGCWSCKWFDNGQIARDLWEKSLRPRDLKVLADRLGCTTLTIPEGTPALRQMDRMNVEIQTGTTGVCMKGSPGTDLVQHRYLCGNWTGRDGASVARAGAKPDDLPDELMDKFNPK